MLRKYSIKHIRAFLTAPDPKSGRQYSTIVNVIT